MDESDDQVLSRAMVSVLAQTTMSDFNQRVTEELERQRDGKVTSRSSDETSQRILETTAGRQLRCVCSSVVPLGRYYATYTRRADWDENWRQEMQKGEKLQVRFCSCSRRSSL